MTMETEEDEPLLPDTQVDLHPGLHPAAAQHEGELTNCCTHHNPGCIPLRAGLTATCIVATVSVLVSLWSARSHSCPLATEFNQALALESAADHFQPTNATVHSLHVHLCPDCRPFGGVQPSQNGWLEGEYTYNYSRHSYSSRRLAAATARGHLPQYTQLKHALDTGEAVTAWVDPRAPGTAVLDRKHYVREEDEENAYVICAASVLVMAGLLMLVPVPVSFVWLFPHRLDDKALMAHGVVTLLYLWIGAFGVALIQVAGVS